MYPKKTVLLAIVISAVIGASLAASASARLDSGELRRDLAVAAYGSEGGQRGGGGTRIAAGQDCPPGTTETRPGSCQAPSTAPPSIVDYRPKSTLVTAEHKVPKAKFPVIDVHSHQGQLTQDSIKRLIETMDPLNLQVLTLADNISGERLVQTLAAINASPYKDRFRALAGINFQNVGPGWADKAIQQLRADIKAGALGVGEVGKQFGLRITKPDGSRLKVDDPDIDPLWDEFAKLDVPAFIHTAEPQEFFQPQDMTNERWLELSLFADRRNNQPGQVTFEQLMTERNNMIRKHPKTRFVLAHFGWHANDLQRLGKLLDEFPNVTVEAGAVLYDFGRQPRAAHDFFVKYQDRILFGKDSYQPEEFPYYWRVFETADEYFDYYRDYHAFWKMYGMSLPDDVLKKVYYKNAVRIFKGMPTGFPQ